MCLYQTKRLGLVHFEWNLEYSGKEGDDLILWIREIEMAMRSGLIKLDHRQISSPSSMEELWNGP
uniref:PH domain-containing protein n=1 Tax=Peronospora matthiolae TaxID=2874970 RepID=A0AAV1TYM6_9STRA